MSRGVAIAGVGCLSAAGPDLRSSLASMLAGHRNPAPTHRFPTNHPVLPPVFEVPTAWLDPSLPRTLALALAATRQALEDAGLSQEALGGLRVGLCLGTTVGQVSIDEAAHAVLHRGGTPDPVALLETRDFNLSLGLATLLGCRGPCQTVVNACSSGTDALGLGASWITAGLCDLVLAGGADALGRIPMNGFMALKVVDMEPCRPFCADRRGLNLGEGAGIFVLVSPALEARQRVRGRILGYGCAADAYHATAPHPEGRGLRKAIGEAMTRAGVGAGDLAFVNAHGTGTPDNDRVEGRVLAQELPGVPFVSTKAYTGHTLGAAGAVEAAFTLASLESQRLPGLPVAEPRDLEIWGAAAAAPMDVRGTAALSLSLAFGGNNAALVLEVQP